jgi:hypothetical protein
MDILHTIATLLPLAVTSGINLYATVLVAGLCIQFGWVENTPAALAPLGTWPVIIAAGFFFLVEALADKIPFIDNAWDVLHTLIRPLGAAILAFNILGDADPALVVIGAMAAGSVTLVAHGGKASTRVALNVMSPFEGCSNIGLSAFEDVLAASITFLALKYPFVASGITLFILLAILLFAPRLVRWVFYTIRSLFKWMKGTFTQVQSPDPLPPAHQRLLAQAAPGFSLESLAQSLKGAAGRGGYLSLGQDGLYFTYSRSGDRVESWQASYPAIQSTQYRKRGLLDVLEVTYRDPAGATRLARFTFQKDRSTLAARFAAELQKEIQAPVGAVAAVAGFGGT